MNKFFQLLGLIFLALTLSFTTFNDKKTIIIDAGHGGQDLGVNRNGVTEKEIVLDIAKRIQKLNKNKNIEIILTRDSDQFVSLTDRSGLGNRIKPTMILSLHVNGSQNKRQKGSLVFNQPSNLELAKKLAAKFGDCAISEQKMHLLTKSEAPALLLEIGYMTNEADRNYLNSESGKNEIAHKIVAFINEN